jgi:hypothetical protein
MKLTITHNGLTLTRETPRVDVTHVMVCNNGKTGKPEIMGLHNAESKAKADARKCNKIWANNSVAPECVVYAL